MASPAAADKLTSIIRRYDMNLDLKDELVALRDEIANDLHRSSILHPDGGLICWGCDFRADTLGDLGAHINAEHADPSPAAREAHP